MSAWSQYKRRWRCISCKGKYSAVLSKEWRPYSNEPHLNLRDASTCRRQVDKLELAQEPVFGGLGVVSLVD